MVFRAPTVTLVYDPPNSPQLKSVVIAGEEYKAANDLRPFTSTDTGFVHYYQSQRNSWLAVKFVRRDAPEARVEEAANREITNRLIGMADQKCSANILQPYHMSDTPDGSHLVLIMEAFESDLLHLVSGQYPVCAPPFQFVMTCVHQIAYATRCLHQINVVYVDLKPSNVLVNQNPLRFVVMDFNGSTDVGGSDMFLRHSKGYTSSEYMDSGRAGFSDDVFALGATLYEVVTAQPSPFETRDDFVNYQQVMSRAHAIMGERMRAAAYGQSQMKLVWDMFVAMVAFAAGRTNLDQVVAFTAPYV